MGAKEVFEGLQVSVGELVETVKGQTAKWDSDVTTQINRLENWKDKFIDITLPQILKNVDYLTVKKALSGREFAISFSEEVTSFDILRSSAYEEASFLISIINHHGSNSFTFGKIVISKYGGTLYLDKYDSSHAVLEIYRDDDSQVRLRYVQKNTKTHSVRINIIPILRQPGITWFQGE